MRKKSPLKISSLQLWAYSPGSEAANDYQVSEWFDDRSDFLLTLTQSAIAVKATFFNERQLQTGGGAGVRRSVTVALLDETEVRLMSKIEIRVNIPRGESCTAMRADLPLAYANIDSEHTYKVTIRDTSTDEILEHASFRFFDPLILGNDPGRWYQAESGGIIPSAKSWLCKSAQVCTPDVVTVQFDLTSNFRTEPCLTPEVELRVYLPNGRIERQFIRPECEDFDNKEYVVSMHYPADHSSRGVGYAELTCMEYPVAGFVFSTDGPDITGKWWGGEMTCLDEYSQKECLKRFYEQLKDRLSQDEEALPDEDDDFERRLNEFILSETAELGEETADPKYTEEEEEEEEDIVDEENDTDKDSVHCDSENESEVEEPALQAIDCLIGLDSVKNKLKIYEKVVNFNRLRNDSGLSVSSTPLHSMFLGSPGTGKTTVAKRMGAMLRKAGALSKGHVVIKERSTLLGPYYSNEETNTLKAIEEAQGGILLIDEAYQLYQPEDPRDPGKFVIEALMTALADESRRDWMLILAGYPEEMRRMFEMNPGLKSRIPESNIYMFEDFTEPQLLEIADRYLERNDYHLSPEARAALSDRLASDYVNKDKSFGNARHVINMIQTDIIPAMAVRVMSEPSPDIHTLSEVLPGDIPRILPAVKIERPKIGFRM